MNLIVTEQLKDLLDTKCLKVKIISTIYNDKNCFKISLKTSQLFINYNFNKY